MKRGAGMLRYFADMVRYLMKTAFKNSLPALLAFAVLLGLTVAAYQRNRIYQTRLGLWVATAAASPHKQRPHQNLGQALSVAGFPAQALSEFSLVLSLPWDNSVEKQDVYREMGNVYLFAGRYDEAAAAYRTGLRYPPTSPTILHNLAIILLKQKNYDEAAAYAEAALAADPSWPNVLNTLGQIYVAQGAIDKGIPFLLAALEKAPESAASFMNLALAYEKKKDYETAFRYAGAYAAADTSPFGRKRAAELLARLQNKSRK